MYNLSRRLTFLSENGSAHTSPWFFVSTWDDPVQGAPIIPHSNGANSPFPPHSMIVGGMDVAVEEVEQLVGFGLFELSKTRDEAIVHVESFEASDRMGPHCWMMSIYRSAVGRNTP